MKGVKRIIFHGKLSHFFGSEIKLFVSNNNLLISALDCAKKGFRQKIKQLHENGENYCIVEDDENKNKIHILPMLSGSSKSILYVVAVVLIIIGVVLLFLPGMFWFGMTLISSGLSMVITTATMKGPKENDNRIQNYQSLKGQAYSTEDSGRTYVFSNNMNSATQGSSISIGYGVSKIASSLISVSIKNYSQGSKFLDQSELDKLSPPFYDFLAN
jgi:predicted phage tail protein